ncbi:hypothetical protein RJ639_037779 [Escallonia herrerae]|uniref:RanBD1 domain-containing protein n=1 Tax=Escallonia herrerae TaxID=1293975 RepID=A0AA88WIL7_9ASTE|nr:hypothetical protein RJ639_037779 [Escallonia herrerae]
MEDAENILPPSKKRVAARQLSKDNPEDSEEEVDQESGTFKKASEEVLASRKIIKARRHQSSAAPSAPSSNPFAGIRLVPSTPSNATPAEITTEKVENLESKVDEKRAEISTDVEKNDATQGVEDTDKQSQSKVDEAGSESTNDKEKIDTVNEATKAAEGAKTENAECNRSENEVKKDNADENVQKSAAAASFSSFQQLSSSQNAFTGVAGTGFSSSTFSFGSIPKDGPSVGSGSLFGLSNNGNSSLFGTAGASIVCKREASGFPSMQEVPVETGEENEKAVFTADSVLFEFLDGGWKERGKGELRVNVSTSGTAKARLVMRARGNLRLILNASLYADMKLANMDKKGITFACVNSTGEGKEGLSTFALKFKDASIVEEFREAVTEHKDKTSTALKTPENSPKASDD